MAAQWLGQDEVVVSDLLPQQYEGGFKLWEAAIDLAKYAVRELLEKQTDTPPARVIELGCGHGLPGIVAMLAGAEVHFQASAENSDFFDFVFVLFVLACCPHSLFLQKLNTCTYP
jgi:hypothetical protein